MNVPNLSLICDGTLRLVMTCLQRHRLSWPAHRMRGVVVQHDGVLEPRSRTSVQHVLAYPERSAARVAART